MIFKSSNKDKRIYLDYASSTPASDFVLKKIPKLPEGATLGNPGSLHKEGLVAKDILERSRERIAKTLSSQPDEIIFTSGATESDNLAIRGLIEGWVFEEKIKASEIEIILSDLEHFAVLETAKKLSYMYGISLKVIPSKNGIVQAKEIKFSKSILRGLVSVMMVQNEIGTVQPIKDVAKQIRFLRKENTDRQIVFHVDATQAPMFYALSVLENGVDLMTVGSNKLFMNKGVGILYKSRRVKLSSILSGGGQERGLRPGTENIYLAHEFSYALKFAQDNKQENYENIRNLQFFFEELMTELIPEASITCQFQERTPHITHVSIPNFDSELLVIELDALGIAVSSHSACLEEVPTESFVGDLYPAKTGFIRFSFGPETTKKDLQNAVLALRQTLAKYSLQL